MTEKKKKEKPLLLIKRIYSYQIGIVSWPWLVFLWFDNRKYGIKENQAEKKDKIP